MKRTILSLLVLLVLLVSSCKKNNTGGSWNFKGTNYNAKGCDAFSGYMLNVISNGSLDAATSTTPDNSISVVFCYNYLPHSNGTYSVIDTGAIGYDQVSIGLKFGYNSYTGSPATSYYEPTRGNGHNQTIQVTVAGGGKISASGNGIMMRNSNNPADSGILNFNITQTN